MLSINLRVFDLEQLDEPPKLAPPSFSEGEIKCISLQLKRDTSPKVSWVPPSFFEVCTLL